ncbi:MULTISPECIES: phosphatidylserine decarboxylase family protein [Sphingobacterium]|uniref:Phosphatidylserine decarboxylase proenzyme n=1 Tax=Sphingobacterium paramultivorum TaxID=2886510 RepID=A0A7G5E7M9_9SPHI|nr:MULTISPECIES: phosphatidylserine decarboxylase family protein [Sphingobacterium]MBB1644689.1 phosphatidylserine decarboxylase [Sphingobacterium sp. UME9]MCS4168438.1 phosphatidylserine decarboxylase [Sphingobacterium sp. BIGb0116]QMV70004.1 phosphatidylserine decarboxylase family protein [Sphingobacterium paramultivorum]WET71049.1 MAG: phosphatidylserine decarboxylase family protein [Sphingobacterium sp.]WSO13835.1 phosphatidylserine decarboxylase family protein [Sphingobacterium paramultiv
MKFHKEGYTTLAIAVLFIFIINAVADYYDAPQYAKWLIYVLSAFLFITVVQFFRSPKKVVNPQDGVILCPADGKVVVIEETEENEYFHDKRIQVSIFMSPVNVHVNRNPISGLVTFFKYHPGKFLVAWHPKSSTDNERTTVVVKDKAGREVLFRQIAGALARRIVWYVKEKDEVVQGNEFGFIKFGSRVDLFLPLGTEINVNIGDKVTGARTIIGKF